MSRLMTGILLVALLGLTAGMAWAQRVSTGAPGSDESAYLAGDPPTYRADNPNGFPVAAQATFKATVLNYGQVSITPPADLTVPGDSGGVAGEDRIEWNSDDAGLIEVEANTDHSLLIEVTEFRGDTVAEDIWTEIQLGELSGKFYGTDEEFLMLEDYPNDIGWQRISGTPGWTGFEQTSVTEGTRGTVILDREVSVLCDPGTGLGDDARYWQLPFGVLAKNRTFDAYVGRHPVLGAEGYTTLALAQNYTATMYVTLTKP